MKDFLQKHWVKILLVVLVLGGIGAIIEQFGGKEVETNIVKKEKKNEKVDEKIVKEKTIKEIFEDKKYEIQYICEEKVKEKLKAPRTAKFDTNPGFDITGEKQATVVGTVDSQNSFGALLRNKVLCKFNYNKDQKDFELLSVDIFE